MTSEHYADEGVRVIRLQNIETSRFDDEDKVLRSRPVRQLIDAGATEQSTLRNIGQDFVRRIVFAWPPPHEQDGILGRLREQLHRLDGLAQRLAAQVEKLREYRQALITAAVTGQMLIPLEDKLKRDFYAEMCRVERWSTRQLRERIGSMLFERTAPSKKPEALIKKELSALRESGELTLDLVMRDPYMLPFLGLADTYGVRDLEAAILPVPGLFQASDPVGRSQPKAPRHARKPGKRQ